ncbi:hypothetical protein GCM10022243_10760 [Saccharothrix violaceirubra]|uniref:Uncharacterized protein n=1 Tax=Saccharothrix violaceirubra TaxID=413306 RepID=A0A7W7T3U6_9PSEU|nr:hypothetical protein [Saccharothrix violaceirubra]MBB4966085.1 hypothetical protein [Saccharothrix violaceirubra]
MTSRPRAATPSHDRERPHVTTLLHVAAATAALAPPLVFGRLAGSSGGHVLGLGAVLAGAVVAGALVTSLAGAGPATLDWWFLLAFAVVLPVQIPAVRRYLRDAPEAYRSERTASARRARLLLESPTGTPTGSPTRRGRPCAGRCAPRACRTGS